MGKTTVSNNHASDVLRKIAMFFLALLPLLHWYEIGAPIGLGEVLMLIVTIIAFAKGYYRKNVFPKLFYVLWAYIAFNWCYNNGIHVGLALLPGGPTFFVFSMITMGSVLLFDLGYLYKIMKWIVLISILIFLFQFILLYTSGTHFCFVPNLTGGFTYENFTYAELAARHYKSVYPCAIFIEKSYMAYYLVIFLCLELFYGRNKDVLFSRLSLFIIFILLILRSGSGLVGMVIPVASKFIVYYWEKKNLRIFNLLLFFPFIVAVVYFYLGTEIGTSMLDRQTEITTEGTSGFTRISYGYIYFDRLNAKEKLLGASTFVVNELIYMSYADRKFALNGIQSPLINIGCCGLALLVLFYLSLFRKTDPIAKLCILTYFVLSAIEVTYLGPYMMILTIIPCSIYNRNKRIQK